MKVITPAWLTDSVERGALLNWRDYVFRPGHRLEGAQGRSINQMSLFTPRRTENPVRAPPATLRAPDHSADLSISSSHEEQESSLGRNSPRLVEQHESQDDLDPSPLPPNQLGLIRDTPSPPPPNQLAARGEDILTPSPEELSVERFQTPPGLFIMAEYDQTADDQASATETLFAVKPTVHSQVGKGPDHAVSKSNQDAQRVMADANWRAAHTSAAPDFIEGYYKNSRLHHLSTWKAELRALVQEAQERAENGIDVPGDDVNADGMAKFVGARLLDMTSIKGKGRQKIASHTDRVIMHCDFDSVCAHFADCTLVGV
jgi:DNA repair protein REV1